MPRPKGSKNKVKDPGIDWDLSIGEAQGAREATVAEIEEITNKIAALKTDLKNCKKELKSIDNRIASMEKKKAAAEQKAAEEAKKTEATELVKKALASGYTVDNILELLK